MIQSVWLYIFTRAITNQKLKKKCWVWTAESHQFLSLTYTPINQRDSELYAFVSSFLPYILKI